MHSIKHNLDVYLKLLIIPLVIINISIIALSPTSQPTHSQYSLFLVCQDLLENVT